MQERLLLAFRFLVASGILGTLSIYAAKELSFGLWILFLFVFTFSILILTRLIEMWTVIPTFIVGKVWVYTLGSMFNLYGILIIALSFYFLFFAELKRLNFPKRDLQENHL